MTRFLLRRIGFGLLVVWLVATAVFLLFYVGPSDPAVSMCSGKCNESQLAQTRARLGLDEPVLRQYVRYVGQIVQLDFGRSSRLDRPVLERLGEALSPTLSLVLGAAILWLVIGVAAGIVSARRPGSWRDRGITVAALVSISVPTFVVGMVLLYLFTYLPARLGYVGLPASKYVPLAGKSGSLGAWLSHLVLPWASLVLVSAGVYARLTRTAMLGVLGEDFVRTARAKGISEWRIVWRHVLHAAAPGVLTVFGVDLGTLLGGSLVIEPLFNLHGLGQEAVDALRSQDLPMIMGVVLVGTVAVVAVSLILDIVHARLDPRVTLH